MDNSINYVAFALHSGKVHLCLDSRRGRRAPATSLCREVVLSAPRAPVDPEDLGNIQNFIICKGCETRFNLLGYKHFYAQSAQPLKPHPAQLALF